MAKIFALLILLLALGGGGAAGYFLQPPPPKPEEGKEEAEVAEQELIEPSTVVTFQHSFAIPVLRGGRAWTHVILSLGVESNALTADVIHQREPVIRDSLTEALFLHGSLGDFDGDFTEPMAMNRLRTRLNDAAIRALQDDTARILIVSITRQQS